MMRVTFKRKYLHLRNSGKSHEAIIKNRVMGAKENWGESN